MNRAACIHLFTNFAPIGFFFVVGQFYSFYIATAVLVGATAVSLLISWLYERHIPLLPIISGVFIIVSGVVTLIYEIPDAIIFADTLYYFFFAIVLAYGLVKKKFILKFILQSTFAAADEGWRILSVHWCIVFFVTGIANEYVRIFMSPEAWIDFNFYKTIALSFFIVYQLRLSKKYRIKEITNAWGIRTEPFCEKPVTDRQ